MADRHTGVRPQGAKVQQHQLSHGKLQLLGLPPDVRSLFWKYIAELVDNQPQELSGKPKNEYFNLLLTCRQIYHELETSWRRFCVPWNRVDKMLRDVPNAVTIHQFRSLTLEIPQNASSLTLLHLCGFLFKSQHVLKELRIYFYGTDKYDTRIFSHGCGNLEDEKSEKKLPIDGQNFERFARLWQTITFLRKLEVLVISNANLQIFQYMVLAEKPELKYLRITGDPRSTLHQDYTVDQLGNLLIEPVKDMYPPVEALNISANAAFISIQIAIKLMETLQHLTWTVPDSSLGSGGMATPWYTHTAELFKALRLRAHRLEVLRVCIGGTGIYETYGGYDELVGSIRLNFKHLRSLRRFEFHCKTKSYWFGKELVQSVPYSLTNIYLSDRVIHPYDLLCVMREEVLKSSAPESGTQRGNPSYQTNSRRHPQSTNNNLGSISHMLPVNQEPWLIKLNPISYETYDSDMENIFEKRIDDSSHVARQPESHRDNGFLDCGGSDLIGEDLNRQDYIPFHTRRLIFLHFEYDHSENAVHSSCPLTTFQVMLFINGRLLDRFRNKHLISYDRGKTIKPRPNSGESQLHDKETTANSKNLNYAVMLYNLYDLGSNHSYRLDNALAELKDCAIDNNDDYFGKEDDAQLVFDNEPVARVENLQKLTYIVEKEVCVDGKCHWSCPDAKIEV